MPITTKDRSQTPQTPFDIELEMDERAKKALISLEDREAADDFNEEERAIQDGLEILPNGKVMRRHGSKEKALNSTPRIKDLFGEAFSVKGIENLFAYTFTIAKAVTSSALAGTFSARAKADGLPPKYEDADYLYDAMDVSEPVYEALMRESEIVAKKLEELEAITDPIKHKEKTLELQKLATEYDMRIHPLTGVYVHDIHRVESMEERLNPHQRVCLDRRISVFQLKAELNDVRGIKILVGDQFEQDGDGTVGNAKAGATATTVQAEVKPKAPGPAPVLT